jgi:hypothetical protein
MQVYQDQDYNFLPSLCLKAILGQAEAVICSVLTDEIKQAKQQKPKLTLIHFTDKADWAEIFTNKVHLTIEPQGNYFNVYTLDGAEYAVSRGRLTQLIEKLLTSKYYHTKIKPFPALKLDAATSELINTYPQYPQHGQNFGTFAIRLPQGGFLTSTRGKQQGLRSVSRVFKVDHNTLTVHADTKATLNAPLLDKMLDLNPHINFLLHGHELKGKVVHSEYEFAGTTGDLKFADKINSGEKILLPHHGYLVGFETFEEIDNFIKAGIWNNYREQFPVRYLQPSKFDEDLTKFLQSHPKAYLKVLDIGGGEEGTKALNLPRNEVYYLDPYVVKPPAWVKGRINWDSNETFDLVIARGSLNYLTPEQLEKIPLFLNKGGTFMANTFLKPPGPTWQEKEVTNAYGVKGLERTRLVNNTVEHQVIFPDYQVNHSFFYYSLDDYFSYFKFLLYQPYGHNSVIIKVIN